MSAQPQWSPVDDETADLLSLVARGNVSTDTADREWDWFRAALELVACMHPDDVISPNRLRPEVRDRVAPQRIGAFTNRALAQNLIQATGEWEVSDDREGRNGGKPARVYRWIGGAS